MTALGSPETPGQVIATVMAAIRSQSVGRVWTGSQEHSLVPLPSTIGLWDAAKNSIPGTRRVHIVNVGKRGFNQGPINPPNGGQRPSAKLGSSPRLRRD
jgi:hypothetical protein